MFMLLCLLIAIGYIFFNSYNGLQRRSQDIREAYSNIDVTLNKKVNLVNQLMDVVKNYQDSEQFMHLTALKETVESSNLQASYNSANSMVAALQGVASRYPELKADRQYAQLSEGIKECEQDLLQSRTYYNAAVNQYNSFRASIPTVFFANILKFGPAQYLDFSVNDNTQTVLNQFKTDDGERLNELLSNAKSNLLETSKNALNKSKGLVSGEKVVEPTFFYMVGQSTPKGPVTQAQLLKIAQQEGWQDDAKITLVGEEHWLSFREWSALYVESSHLSPH